MFSSEMFRLAVVSQLVLQLIRYLMELWWHSISSDITAAGNVPFPPLTEDTHITVEELKFLRANSTTSELVHNIFFTTVWFAVYLSVSYFSLWVILHTVVEAAFQYRQQHRRRMSLTSFAAPVAALYVVDVVRGVLITYLLLSPQHQHVLEWLNFLSWTTENAGYGLYMLVVLGLVVVAARVVLDRVLGTKQKL